MLFAGLCPVEITVFSAAVNKLLPLRYTELQPAVSNESTATPRSVQVMIVKPEAFKILGVVLEVIHYILILSKKILVKTIFVFT